MKKTVFLIIFSVLLFAVNIQSNGTQNAQNSQQQADGNDNYGIKVPYLASPAPIYVQRKRFEINTYVLKNLYKQIYKKYQQRQQILNNTFDLNILMKPAVKFIKPVNLVYINPQFITQIIFPQGFRITSAVAGFDTNLFVYAGNELHFRVKRDFVNGNMIIYLTNGKKNLSINLLVENYMQKKCKKIKGKLYCLDGDTKHYEPLYKFAYSNYALVYKFIDRKPLPPLEVIAFYEKLTGKSLNIKKNGDFAEYTYKNITYFIYRNDKFGNIIFKGKKYIVKP